MCAVARTFYIAGVVSKISNQLEVLSTRFKEILSMPSIDAIEYPLAALRFLLDENSMPIRWNQNSHAVRLEPGAASRRGTQWSAIENCRLFGVLERKKQLRQNEWKGERGKKNL